MDSLTLSSAQSCCLFSIPILKLHSISSSGLGTIERLLLLVQDDEGPDEMLWLSQQFADEILQVLTTLSTSQEVVA
ncbi:MAG: hypothetical protein Q7T55_04215 [Solirubrobacteraceae bacterium]|nr:hypothetical protein [Solirubrobacteraceae bacterium]